MREEEGEGDAGADEDKRFRAFSQSKSNICLHVYK